MGLSLGIAASFLILSYVHKELSYDKGFQDADRVYRIATDFYNMGGFACSQEILQNVLISESKDIEVATQLDYYRQETDIHIGEQVYTESGIYEIDSTFFKVFSFDFIEGSPPVAGLPPNGILLTESVAQKFFGLQPALGKSLLLGKNKRPFQVMGVVKSLNHPSHLEPRLFVSIYSNEQPSPRWTSAAVYNYVKLKPQGTVTGLEGSLESILENHVHPASGSSDSFETWKQSTPAVRFFIQPLKDIHLYSKYKFELSAGGNPQQVFILGIIGLFIIFISSINYINLTTARSSIRAKEVGVRKTLGAARSKLVFQFLGESIAFSLLAMVLAGGMAELLVNILHRLFGEVLIEFSVLGIEHLFTLFAFSLIIGILSGLYPSFYLTAFKPVNVLKGEWSLKGNKGLRSGLVVFQFVLAIVLMISSLVVFCQLQFMQEKDLGFHQEGVLLIDNFGSLKNNANAFKTSLEQQSKVAKTSRYRRVPAGKSIWMYTYKTPEMTEEQTVQTFPVDEDYLETLELQLLEGRNFNPTRDSNSVAAIINEAAVKAMGLQNPIGAEINQGQRVIGVIKDFHFQSMRKNVEPAVMVYYPDGYGLAVKLSGNQLSGFVEELPEIWATHAPTESIRYHFLDENFAQLLAQEKTLSRMVSFFTLLAILIACLGLFGLAAFTTEQRTKEIGIRKILGAGMLDITSLLTKEFIVLVVIAGLIALPFSWWAMNRWLQDFAFRIELQSWMVILPVVVALFITLFIVSYQSIRAALANPVNALKYE